MSGLPADRFVTVHDSGTEPEMTVLMPVFEQQRWVGQAVLSVLAQRHIACEVIISDDASTDGTFEEAFRSVSATITSGGALPHRIVMRRGAQRLARDHLLLVSRQAGCDIVAWAHGDDVSVPDRMRTLADLLQERGSALAASAYSSRYVDGTSVPRRVARAARHWSTWRPGTRACDVGEVVAGPWWLIGSTQAWRRSLVAHFPPLTSSYLPAGHDRLLPIRAAFSGGVATTGRKLVRRLEHGGNWSQLALQGRDPDTHARTLAEMHLEVLARAEQELTWLTSIGLVDPHESLHWQAHLHREARQRRGSARRPPGPLRRG